MTTADLQHEFLTVAEVAALTRHDPESVRRWIISGIKVAGRGRVKLIALMVGGRRLVRRDAIDAFLSALNPVTAPVPESPAAFQRRARAAKERVLKMIGGDRN